MGQTDVARPLVKSTCVYERQNAFGDDLCESEGIREELVLRRGADQEEDHQVTPIRTKSQASSIVKGK